MRPTEDYLQGADELSEQDGAVMRTMELRAWALKTLDGTARGCVRRSRNIPLEQLVGLESRFRRNGVLSRDESVAVILTAIAGVPNPDPTKFAAVTAEFRA